MTKLSLRRLFRLATGRDQDAEDREAELELHLALATEELIAEGLPADEARRHAERRFGDRDRVAKQVRAIDRHGARSGRRRERLGRWLADGRLALRGFGKDPWFAAAATVLIALGLGGNVAVFTVFNAAFFHPLPYPDAARLVDIHEARLGSPMRASGQNFRDWSARQTSFTALAAYYQWDGALTGTERPEVRLMAPVSREFSAVMGIDPLIGRWFDPEESRMGGPPVAVVSEAFWRQRLGGDPGAVGRVLHLDGHPASIVGVMPATLDFPVGTDVWIPAEPHDDNPSRTAHNWNVIGRLRPGVSVAEAAGALGVLTRQLVADQPPSQYLADDVRLTPFRERLLGESPELLYLLQAAVGLLFLIAIFNLTALFLARAAKRAPEVAMMLTLGADRSDLLRRFVVEAVSVTVLGATLGIAGWLVVRSALVSGIASVLPFVRVLPLDWQVVGFLVVGMVLVAVVGAYLPAGWSRRAVERGGIRRTGVRVTGPLGLMRGLVAVEVAATFTLLVGSGLLVRSLERLLAVDLGYQTGGRVLVPLRLLATEGSRYATAPGQFAFFEQLVSRVRALPGVRSAAITSAAPLLRSSPDGSARIQGEPSDAGGPAAESDFRVVGVGFFDTMGIPLVAGRAFEAADHSTSPYVTVVNQAFATRHLRGENPIGRLVRFPGMDAAGDDRWAMVVGLVGDTRQMGPSDEAVPAIYYAVAQRPQIYRTNALVVRVDRSPQATVSAIRSLMVELDPTIPVEPVLAEEALRSVTSAPRLRTMTLGLFAGAALLLAAAGLFGVVGFVLAGQTRELGVRIALGATSARVAAAAARHALVPVAAGIGLGIGIAVLLGRLVGGLLFEVTATDPAVYLLAGSMLIVVATAACAGPIRRAIRIDPILTLRSE